MRRRGDREYLLDILTCRRISRYIHDISYEDFISNGRSKKDAVIHNIEVIGEAVKRLSDDIKGRYPNIEWRRIAGMRDKVIYNYFGVSLEIEIV